MKKLLAITVLTLLGAGFAAAQSPQEMGNTATPGATFATGVVISTTSDSIVIRKDSGESLTLFLDPATVGSHNNAVGSRVQINYRMDEGRAIATEIRGPGESAAASSTAASVTPSAAPVVATAPPPAPLPAPEPMAAEDTDVDVAESDLPETEASTLSDEESEAAALPATASKGPAIALLGLLALGGAAALRVAR